MKKTFLTAAALLLLTAFAAAVFAGCGSKYPDSEKNRIVGKWYSSDPELQFLSADVTITWEFFKDGTFSADGIGYGKWEYTGSDNYELTFGSGENETKTTASFGETTVSFKLGNNNYVLKKNK